VPLSVLFDGLISNVRSSQLSWLGAGPVLELLSSLLEADHTLLTHAIDARTAFGDDVTYLRLLSVVSHPNIDAIPLESIATLRACVATLVSDAHTQTGQLLDALNILNRLVELDVDEDVAWKQRALLAVPGLTPHFFRLLDHSSNRVRIAAMNVLNRSMRLAPILMAQYLRSHHINCHHLGQLCRNDMVTDCQTALRWIVHLITRESLIVDAYDDFLPLLVRILRSTGGGEDMVRARLDSMRLLAHCVDQVGRPAEELLLQFDAIPLLIDSIGVDTLLGGARLQSHNLHIFHILRALLTSDIDAHGDDGATLHPWMAQLVDSKQGLAGLEGTHPFTLPNAD
jgi:hypothetical protein